MAKIDLTPLSRRCDWGGKNGVENNEYTEDQEEDGVHGGESETSPEGTNTVLRNRKKE